MRQQQLELVSPHQYREYIPARVKTHRRPALSDVIQNTQLPLLAFVFLFSPPGYLVANPYLGLAGRPP